MHNNAIKYQIMLSNYVTSLENHTGLPNFGWRRHISVGIMTRTEWTVRGSNQIMRKRFFSPLKQQASYSMGSFDLPTLITSDNRHRSRTPFNTILPLPNQSSPTRCNAITPTIRWERTLRTVRSEYAQQAIWPIKLNEMFQLK